MEGPAGRGEEGETEVRARGWRIIGGTVFFISEKEKQGKVGSSISQDLRRGSAAVCVCLCKVQVVQASGPDGYKCGLAS